MANTSDPQLLAILREQLRDIHTPPEIGWWPPAPGWWLLAGIVLVGGFVLSRLLYKRWRIRQYRHYLIAQLDSYFEQWQVERITSAYCQSANQLLKRSISNMLVQRRELSNDVSNAIDPSILSLSGAKWISALEALYQPLSVPTRAALSEYLYQPEAKANAQIDVPSLHAELRQWLLKHDTSGQRIIGRSENSVETNGAVADRSEVMTKQGTSNQPSLNEAS